MLITPPMVNAINVMVAPIIFERIVKGYLSFFSYKSVPLIPSVRELLDLYRLRLGNPTTGVMFKTDANTPIDLKNLFTRRIDPVLKACSECGKAEERHEREEHEFRRRKDL